MYQSVIEYLSTRNIPYKTSGDKTEAIICCLFCEDTKYKLYISNTEGCYHCKKCGAKGSWKDFTEKLGDTSPSQLEANNKVEYTVELNPANALDPNLVSKYHQNLPDRIKNYLKSEERGLTDETISQFQIGWDGKSITIPVYDVKGNLINIRHRRDPQRSNGPKVWNEKGCKASLFNIKALEHTKKQNPSRILLTEGEFDAMVATQHGFPAISGTGGSGTLKKEWVKELDDMDAADICYDTDAAGKQGALNAATLLGNKSRIVELPSKDGAKVDITDYFGRLKHTAEDFQKLLDQAKPVEITSDKFELLDAKLQKAFHPALDYYEDQLYITLSLPVKAANKETVKPVVISSSKQKGLIEKNLTNIGGKQLSVRKVTTVPGDHIRWRVEDIQRYLNSTEAVSPALPFIEIRQVLLRFVDFRKETDADILTLWLLGTYCFPIFDAFPYIYLIGVKRSGKTKTLLLIEKLAFNAILSSNISPAVLFRLVEAKRCTLALDEGEYLSGREGKEKRQELQELLNSGYKHGAPAYRVKKSGKGDFEIEAFEVYGPKAIANISGLDTVLEDRTITITMIRTNNPDKGNLAVTDGAEDWSYLRSLLYSFALTHAESIADVYNNDPGVNALINRQNELWRPLLSIAKVIDTKMEGVFERMHQEAIRRAEEISSADLEDFDSAVLLALRGLTDIEGESTLTNKEVREKACEFLEEDQHQYFTSRGVGAALKRFGIPGKKIQGYWKYTVNSEILNDLLARYGLQSE